MASTREGSEAGDWEAGDSHGVPASVRDEARNAVDGGVGVGDLVGDMVQPTSEAIRVLAGSEWFFVL